VVGRAICCAYDRLRGFDSEKTTGQKGKMTLAGDNQLDPGVIRFLAKDLDVEVIRVILKVGIGKHSDFNKNVPSFEVCSLCLNSRAR
jgi:hypothetical protein